jgi:hypothetical protein
VHGLADRAGFRLVAEADGNRTRQAELLGLVGFEDRGEHQLPERLPGPRRLGPVLPILGGPGPAARARCDLGTVDDSDAPGRLVVVARGSRRGAANVERSSFSGPLPRLTLSTLGIASGTIRRPHPATDRSWRCLRVHRPQHSWKHRRRSHHPGGERPHRGRHGRAPVQQPGHEARGVPGPHGLKCLVPRGASRGCSDACLPHVPSPSPFAESLRRVPSPSPLAESLRRFPS